MWSTFISYSSGTELQWLYSNYGNENPFYVEKVKVLYRDHGIHGVILEYEHTSSSIEAQENECFHLVLKSLLGKIYKK